MFNRDYNAGRNTDPVHGNMYSTSYALGQMEHQAYSGLERLSGTVRGTLMGLLTGAVATTLAAFELDLWWTAGTGLATAMIVYLLFRRMD